MERGYVKFWRKINDSHLIEYPTQWAVFSHIMLNASYNHYTHPSGVELGPGQMVTTMKKLAAATGQSPKQAKRNLEKLTAANRIATRANPQHTLITIVNWGLYQHVPDEGQTDGYPEDTQMGTQKTRSGQTMGKPLIIAKNTNTKKKEKETQASLALASPEVSEIIRYLNEKAGTSFRESSKGHRRLIEALLKEGYILGDFRRVIEVKCGDWLAKPDMVGNLRPSTLFRKSKFEEYLGQRAEAESEDKGQERRVMKILEERGEL